MEIEGYRMNEILSGGIIISDSSIVHDSALARYREPLGAVRAGERVVLRLLTDGINYKDARLVVLYPNGNQYEAALQKTGDSEGPNMLSVEIETQDEEGIIWYWFRVDMIGGNSVYYGADWGGTAGAGRVYPNEPPAFQLTVCAADFYTPDWTKGAVCYHIFPDRYRMSSRENAERGLAVHHAMGRSAMRLHDSWNELPDHLPAAGAAHYEPLDFFGGDLAGIMRDLPRLAELGVSLIYLNPVSEAASNPRYNTGDY
jgi:4-alpha-glucanotransferase